MQTRKVVVERRGCSRFHHTFFISTTLSNPSWLRHPKKHILKRIWCTVYAAASQFLRRRHISCNTSKVRQSNEINAFAVNSHTPALDHNRIIMTLSYMLVEWRPPFSSNWFGWKFPFLIYLPRSGILWSSRAGSCLQDQSGICSQVSHSYGSAQSSEWEACFISAAAAIPAE